MYNLDLGPVCGSLNKVGNVVSPVRLEFLMGRNFKMELKIFL